MEFFFIKQTKAWVNVRQIVSLFRSNAEWTLTMVGGNTYTIQDDDYLELIKLFGKEKPKKEDDKHPMV